MKDVVVIENKFISNEDVGEYFYASDLVVLPYRTATQSGILNMAYGFLKPVVITNVGGLAEFVDRNNTGVSVELSEASSVAAVVQSFFDLRQKVDFTAEISRYIEKNSFSSISAGFEEIVGNQNKE